MQRPKGQGGTRSLPGRARRSVCYRRMSEVTSGRKRRRLVREGKAKGCSVYATIRSLDRTVNMRGS